MVQTSIWLILGKKVADEIFTVVLVYHLNLVHWHPPSFLQY